MTAGSLMLAGFIQGGDEGQEKIEKGSKAFFPGVRAGYNLIKDLTDGK